jgi:hypothetical protein
MYSAELRPLIPEYLSLLPTINSNDRYWLEDTVSIDDVINRVEALDENITNIDGMSIPEYWTSLEMGLSDPNLGDEPTPLWNLRFAESVVNALHSVYYNHYEEYDSHIPHTWLREGLFAVEILGSVADRMIRVINIVGSGLNFTRDAHTLLKMDRDTYADPLDPKAPEATDYWNHIRKVMIDLLLNDIRTIPTSLDDLFGTVIVDD